jgi:hypothetical protein
MVSERRRKTADLPLAVWPCAQTTSQYQRQGRYLAESARHPGKMIPELARRAILGYSDPGDLVVDPMCGAGTTLVEAIHLERHALGVELEARWAALAVANIALACDQGASGNAGVIEGDARELPHLLAQGSVPTRAAERRRHVSPLWERRPDPDFAALLVRGRRDQQESLGPRQKPLPA